MVEVDNRRDWEYFATLTKEYVTNYGNYFKAQERKAFENGIKELGRQKLLVSLFSLIRSGFGAPGPSAVPRAIRVSRGAAVLLYFHSIIATIESPIAAATIL
jgi:hypothetical protein